MSVKVRLAALGEALAEDLRGYTPYKMATIAGYGRIGGYSRDYQELKRDIREFCDVSRNALPEANVAAADALPPLVRNRLMKERFFAHERDALLSVLGSIVEAARRAPEAQVAASFAAKGQMAADQLGYLLRRAGVKLEPAQARRDAPLGRPKTATVAKTPPVPKTAPVPKSAPAQKIAAPSASNADFGDQLHLSGFEAQARRAAVTGRAALGRGSNLRLVVAPKRGAPSVGRAATRDTLLELSAANRHSPLAQASYTAPRGAVEAARERHGPAETTDLSRLNAAALDVLRSRR